jgi:nicotinate-nucleotide adenylyltransferase
VTGLKIGFLGGSFDPVHFGHLLVAQDVYEQFQLNRLIFVPAAQAPLKPQDAQASDQDRLAMLQAAIQGDERFEISEVELQRGGVSYSIDSVRYFRSIFPEDQLYWIVGADQMAKMNLWKDVAELARLTDFIFVERPGHPATQTPEIPGLRLHRCAGHLIDVSSSELRLRVRQARSLRYLSPPAVISQIEARSLYLPSA